MVNIYKSPAGRDAVITTYDTLLKHMPPSIEHFSVATRYGNTFVLACGNTDLPPLVLLHGSSTNSAMWVNELISLARVYRVFALDLPGEPGKTEAPRLPLNTAACAEWLSDALQSLGIASVTLLGLSLGGWVATKFAVTYPEQVERLALISPSGIGPQRSSFVFSAIFSSLLGEKGIERTLRKVYGNVAIDPTALAYSKLIAKHFNPVVSVIPIFSDAELRRLTMPVLLLVGGKDALLNSARTVERAKAAIPNLQYMLYPEFGHVLINQQAVIEEFFFPQ